MKIKEQQNAKSRREDHGHANMDLLEPNLIPVKNPEKNSRVEYHIPEDDPGLNGSKVETKESPTSPVLCSESAENSASISSWLSHSSEKSVFCELKARKLESNPNMMEAWNISSLGANEFLSSQRENASSGENCDSMSSGVLGICDLPLALTDEIEKFDSEFPDLPRIAFDVSGNQLTQALIFSSTPCAKKSSITFTDPPAVNLFDNQANDSNEFCTSPIKANAPNQEEKLTPTALESWDNFLEKCADTNREADKNFRSFPSEKQNILFLEESIQIGVNGEEMGIDANFSVAGSNKTFIVEQLENQTLPKNDGTFLIDSSAPNGTFVIQDDSTKDKENQSINEEIDSQPSTSSYIPYGIDDQVGSALRNGLLAKLPQAQNARQETTKVEEEWNQAERTIFPRYAYNTMLSPIPEETSFELNDEEMGTLTQISPKRKHRQRQAQTLEACINQ